jgi:hypothetical protein
VCGPASQYGNHHQLLERLDVDIVEDELRSRWRLPAMKALTGLVLCFALSAARAQASARRSTPAAAFRVGLVVTVVSLPAGTPTCRRLELRWPAHPDATRYVVQIAATKDGPWTTLPARNTCGEARAAGTNGLLDVQPANVGSLFYRVTALAGNRAVDSTDAIPIDLKPR